MSDFNVTRRDFGKVGVASTFAILSSQGASAQSNGDTLTVGLLGCGGRGSGALVQMLQGNKNVKLIAMADIFQDRVDDKLKSFQENGEITKQVDVKPDHKFVGIDSYKEILKTDIDILIHGTTPYIRPVHIMAAVDAGKHIFTEKPAAVDAPGIRLFLKAAKKAEDNNLSFVCGLQRRHQKPYVETVKKIQDGALGDITSMRAYWCGSLPFVHHRKPEWKTDLEYCLRNWYAHCWVAGDNIVEQHVHNLDIINWVKNAHPVSVFASGGRTWKPSEARFGDIYDHFSCDYEYGDGSHLLSMSRHWEGAGGVFEEVTGTKGKSNCHDMSDGGGMNPYVQEHINLVNSITGKDPYRNDGEYTAHSTMTAIMGRMSAYTGKKIMWDDAINDKETIVPPLDWDRAYPVGSVPAPGAHKLG